MIIVFEGRCAVHPKCMVQSTLSKRRWCGCTYVVSRSMRRLGGIHKVVDMPLCPALIPIPTQAVIINILSDTHF